MTFTQTQIRAARPDDAAAIARVHVDTWRDAYAGLVPDAYLTALSEVRQTTLWSQLLARSVEPKAVLVAETMAPDGDPTVVGFGNCGPLRNGSHASSLGSYDGEVYTLYVSFDWQGQGLGRGLLTKFLRGLYGSGLNSAVIWVLTANPARYFYEAMGGHRVAERRETFAGVLLDETAYGWPDLTSWLAARGD